MSRDNLDTSNLRKYIKNFQFRELFVESLGWDNPESSSFKKIHFKGKTIY